MPNGLPTAVPIMHMISAWPRAFGGNIEGLRRKHWSLKLQREIVLMPGCQRYGLCAVSSPQSPMIWSTVLPLGLDMCHTQCPLHPFQVPRSTWLPFWLVWDLCCVWCPLPSCCVPVLDQPRLWVPRHHMSWMQHTGGLGRGGRSVGLIQLVDWPCTTHVACVATWVWRLWFNTCASNYFVLNIFHLFRIK